MSNGLPSLFIGSSTEGLDIAYSVQENLDMEAEPTVWKQGIFQPSGNILAELLVESPAARLRRYEARWNDAELTTARRLVREQGVPMSRYELEAADAPAWAAFRKIYGFLDAMSDAVLAGDLDEADTRAAFGQAVVSVWKHAATAFAMPNHVADTWETPPAIARVANRWGAS
jgi:hypothetical protein